MRLNGQIKHRPGRVNPNALYVDIPVEHEGEARTVEVYIAQTYLDAQMVEGKPQGKAVPAGKAKAKPEPGEKPVEVQDAQALTKDIVDRLRKAVAAELKAIKGKEHAQTKDLAATVRAELSAILKDSKS